MSIAGALHIMYANVPCPRCDADVTKPCVADTGYNYDFRYTHSARRMLWYIHLGPYYRHGSSEN